MSLDSAQLTQALRALYTYITRKPSNSSSASTASQLLDDDQFIYLQISLKRTPNRSSTKPHPLPLPHPLYTADTELCLITKDPPRIKEHPTALSTTTAPNAIKQYFTAHPVPGLNRVIAVTKLRKEYNRFKDRRELLALYDLFLADDRILPLLPAVLGVKFFDKKKQPIPVDLSRTAKEKSVQAALRCTYMYVPTGSSLQVKVGRSSMSRQQVHENVMGVIGRLVERLPGKWKGVQMVGVKCGDSITIPVYQSLPLQAIRGGGVDVVNGEEEAQEEDEEDAPMNGEEDDEDEDEDEVEEVRTPVSKAVEAGKKRKRDDAEEETKTPPPVSLIKTPTKTPVKTPLTKTPVQRTTTPKQTSGASASKRVVAMLQKDEADDEDEEDELEVTLHPDLLDDEEDEEPQPIVRSNKKARAVNGTPSSTPKRTAATTTPTKAAHTPATSNGKASTAPATPTSAIEASADKKKRRVETERKEPAELRSPLTHQPAAKAHKAKSSPASAPTVKRQRSVEETKEEQQEAAVTPVARTAGFIVSKTPATTRTASKAGAAAAIVEDDQEEQKSAVKPRGGVKKAVTGRLSLPANVDVEKRVQLKVAPASARKSRT